MGFSAVFLWWLYIFIIGLIFLPLAVKIFARFYDSGYLFAKTIGIAIASYLLWIFSSLRLIPFHRLSILGILALSFGAVYFYFKGFTTLKQRLKSKIFLKSALAEELLFLSAIIIWAFIRGIKPEIYGLEKYMDFGFVNTILRTRYMPPLDMWFAGQSINYYYFGHYICAFLTKLSGIPASITYNLMIATLFSFTLSLGFSITSNLIYLFDKWKLSKALIGGTISALLLTCGSSLHTFVYAYGLPWLKNFGLYHGPIKPYFYPDASRFIGYNPPTHDKTIHEFPFYSFVVADLHAHVSNIPYVLTMLALMIAFILRLASSRGNMSETAPCPEYDGFQKKSIDGISPDTLLSRGAFFVKGQISIELLFIAFLLGIFQMSNFWDFPIYLTVAAAVFFYTNMIRFSFHSPYLKATFVQTVMVLFISMLFTLPFKINNITQGINLCPAHSPLYQLLILWGYQLFFAAAFFILLYCQYRCHAGQNPAPATDIAAKFRQFASNLKSTDGFCIIITLAAIGLVIMPELVYVRDIYGGDYKRANTMFKLTYQSFIMFSLTIGYIYARLAAKKMPLGGHIALNVILLPLICLPLIYPFFAVNLGYYGVPRIKNYVSLDGMQYMDKLHHDDYEAVLWLNRHAKGQPVILEANGDSYSDYDRISIATGLPTVQGWYVHEWLWRGNTDVVNQRVYEVDTVYESDDPKATRDVLRKYNIQYVIIGELERNKFKNIKPNKLLSLGKVVFHSGSTSIIRIN
jgi:Chlor_Arch_YYY domain